MMLQRHICVSKLEESIEPRKTDSQIATKQETPISRPESTVSTPNRTSSFQIQKMETFLLENENINRESIDCDFRLIL